MTIIKLLCPLTITMSVSLTEFFLSLINQDQVITKKVWTQLKPVQFIRHITFYQKGTASDLSGGHEINNI